MTLEGLSARPLAAQHAAYTISPSAEKGRAARVARASRGNNLCRRSDNDPVRLRLGGVFSIDAAVLIETVIATETEMREPMWVVMASERSIDSLPRNYTPHTASWVFHITLTTGNQMDMHVTNCLSGRFSVIHTDIEAAY